MIRRLLRWLGALAPPLNVPGVPNQPATPNRTIRVPDEIWEPAVRKAHAEGKTITEVIVKALERFLRD